MSRTGKVRQIIKQNPNYIGYYINEQGTTRERTEIEVELGLEGNKDKGTEGGITEVGEQWSKDFV